jgi:hypothetical protein
VPDLSSVDESADDQATQVVKVVGR